MNVDTTKQLRHLSYCSGYDGIGIGLELAGFDIGFTVHVEIEAFATFNLVKKMETGALGEGVVWPNLKTFPVEKFRGCFEVLSGGFPCQPFSQAGKRAGDEDERHLFPYILNGIKTMRPALVVLENVDGIVSAKLKGDHWNDPAGTPVLLHVLRELERVGYRATAVASSASEVGAPHQRNRWFIIGLADPELPSSLRLEHISCIAKSLASAEGDKARTRRFGVWPSRPGEEQFGWEPPQVVWDSSGQRRSEVTRGTPENEKAYGGERRNEQQQDSDTVFDRADESCTHRQTKPSLGGNPDGSASGLDYANLCCSCDNRTDELRLLGNGVVPQSCADAVLRGLGDLLADSRSI